MMEISAINPTRIPGISNGMTAAGSAKAATANNPLGGVFSNILGEIAKLDQEAATLEQAMYAGQPVELHQVIIAGEKAGVAFELLIETRNRLVEAYQELMRMPV